MNTPRMLIRGAFGLILSISFTSCSTGGGGNSSRPVDTASATSATAVAPSGVGAVQVSLVKFYNVDGIVPNESQFSDGLDGDGYACSSNLLGEFFSWKGVPFQLGTANKGTNVVSCGGQVIPLPSGKFSKLEMLAVAVNGSQESQNFTIAYADAGMNQTNTQSVSDWYSPDGYPGESQAIDMDYRDQSDGSRDDEPFYIYGYAFNLNPAGTATSLILPTNNNLRVFAVTLVP